MIPVVPAIAANSPFPSPTVIASSDPTIAAFYAARQGSLLWLSGGGDSSAARELISVLERAPLDGLASGPALAAQARALIARGDTSAADQILSGAWVRYVQALQRPPSEMIYADNWVRPHQDSAAAILARASQAPLLSAYVRKVSSVNPIYAQLREAAWGAMR